MILNYRSEGSTAILTMDDGKANALSQEMLNALSEALTRAESEATAVVLAGRPERFCAGFDLKIMMSGPDAAKALVRSGAELLMRLYGSPLPIVAACTGHALAGGALVLLTADHRVGATGPYRIGLNEITIGIPVPTLAMELARDRLAKSELCAATLESRIYDPGEAAKVGYLDEVASADTVIARATQVAAELGTRSRVAYQGTKQRLRGATIRYIQQTLDDDMRAIGG
jgi:enoyl-CoA hydratase